MQFARFARSLAIRPFSGFEIVAVSLALLVTCFASGVFPLMAAGVPSNLAEFAGFYFYTEYSPLNPFLQPLGGWLVVLALSLGGLTRRRYGSAAVVRCMARLLYFGFIGGCWLQAFLFQRSFQRHVEDVFAEAQAAAHAGHPWAGVRGVLDLASWQEALTPSGRFAYLSGSCSGYSDFAWGRIASEGDTFWIDIEWATPRYDWEMEEAGRFVWHDGRRFSIDTLQVYFVGRAQKAALPPDVASWFFPTKLPLDLVDRMAPRFERFLAHAPLRATITSLYPYPRWAMRGKPWRGVIHLGSDQGIMPGMLLCRADRDGPHTMVLTRVDKTDSEFVSEAPGHLVRPGEVWVSCP